MGGRCFVWFGSASALYDNSEQGDTTAHVRSFGVLATTACECGGIQNQRNLSMVCGRANRSVLTPGESTGRAQERSAVRSTCCVTGRVSEVRGRVQKYHVRLYFCIYACDSSNSMTSVGCARLMCLPLWNDEPPRFSCSTMNFIICLPVCLLH